MPDVPYTKLLVLQILRGNGRMRYSVVRQRYQTRLGIGGGTVADASFASMVAEMIALGQLGHSTEPTSDGCGERIAELWTPAP